FRPIRPKPLMPTLTAMMPLLIRRAGLVALGEPVERRLRRRFRGDPKLLVELLVRPRGAESPHPDEDSIRADEGVPAHADRGLDRHPDRGGADDLRLVVLA